MSRYFTLTENDAGKLILDSTWRRYALDKVYFLTFDDIKGMWDRRGNLNYVKGQAYALACTDVENMEITDS